MYGETTAAISAASASKAAFLTKNPLKYWMAGVLAGAYVGFGIVLIFSIGAPFSSVASPAVKILMGVSFGIALTLVIMAGSELFTGLNLVMVVGMMARKVRFTDLCGTWIVSYIGNLAGSLLLASCAVWAGVLNNSAFHAFIQTVASAKMHAPLTELFARGILCNMLVCLAVWMSFRLKEDTAKMIAIFWCLFAFIASGYEHSIANMTLLAIPLLGAHDPQVVSWAGYMRNVSVVTLGNIVGGGVFVGAVYGYISGVSSKEQKGNA